MNQIQPNPTNRKNLIIASICLSVIMMGILFYFFTANITTVIGFIKTVNTVLAPIYAGAIFAFLLLPVHERFLLLFRKELSIKDLVKREKVSNALAIFCSLAAAFFVIYLLLAMVIPELYLTVENLFQSLPSDFVLRTPEWLEEYFIKHPATYEKVEPFYEGAIMGINDWIQHEIVPYLNNMDNILTIIKTTLLPNLTGVVTGVSVVVGAIISFITDSLVALIVSIYLLARKRMFAAQAKKFTYAFLPVPWADFVLDEVRNAYRIMSGFIGGKMLDSAIIGVICLIGSNMLGLPYPLLIATVIGVTNIIPFFGPFIGGVPCGVLIFFVSPIHCLYFIGFIVALQQFDGNILGPKILGDSTGLGSFWVLFAIILFGGLFGLPGMILGVPVFATFYSMMSRLIVHLLKKKNMPTETDAYNLPKSNIKPLGFAAVESSVPFTASVVSPAEESIVTEQQQESNESSAQAKEKNAKKKKK